MRQDQEPQQSADTLPENSETLTGAASQKASSARQYRSNNGLGPHERLRAQVMRAHAVLYADSDASLSLVSRSALGRAVSTFLSEVALQGSRGGSYSRTGPASTAGATSGGRSQIPADDRAKLLQKQRDAARSKKHYKTH